MQFPNPYYTSQCGAIGRMQAALPGKMTSSLQHRERNIRRGEGVGQRMEIFFKVHSITRHISHPYLHQKINHIRWHLLNEYFNNPQYFSFRSGQSSSVYILLRLSISSHGGVSVDLERQRRHISVQKYKQITKQPRFGPLSP